MSNCCSENSESPSALPQSKPGFCPVCGAQGKSVATLTVKSVVRDHTRVPAPSSFLFCRTTTCDVVYFSGQAIFRKPDMKVRVGIKETEDPVPLCYCFDYTREDILREIHKTGETKLAEVIKGEVQDGFCACEVKNPSGSCCLGDITRAIQHAKLFRAEPRRERTTASHHSQSVVGMYGKTI